MSRHVLGTRVVLAVAGLLLVACAAYWRRPVVKPRQDLIIVPHTLHQKKQVECIACHDPIWDAKDLAGNFFPDEAKCLECHKERKAKGDCGMCHTDVKHARHYEPREHAVRMSHADHIPRVKEDCARCHTTLPEGPVGAAAHPVPPMSTCLSCHEHKAEYDEGRCLGCHIDLARYPLKPVSLYSHQGDFVKAHGAQARGSGETCAQCHEATFCSDCHAKTVSTRIELKQFERPDRDFIHRGDYLSRHGMEAQADPGMCQRCHGVSFCESCHAANNLTPRSGDPRNPHPLGWTFPGSPNHHGPVARRDIVSCATCHDQGARSICVDCHRVGGMGPNPHPPGYGDRHPRSEIPGNAMCRYCHP